MAKTSIFQSNMLHHTLVMTLPKDATCNYCTHVGEGFQQESRQAYLQTNFKKAEQQVSSITF